VLRSAFYVVLSIIFINLISCVAVSEKNISHEKVAEANVSLAAEYFRQNRLANALANLKKALKANPDHVEGNVMIALVYSKLQDPEQTRKYFEIAEELVDEETTIYGNVHNNFGTFLCAENNIIEANEHFMLAAENKLYSTPQVAYENSGHCWLKRPDLERAKANFKKALKIDQRLSRSLWQLSSIAFQESDYTLSRQYLEKYEKLTVLDPDVLLLKIRIEKALNGDRVQELVKELNEKFPNSDAAKKWAEERWVMEEL